jgi:calcineurin-like phosphoesterase family protein
MSIGRTTRRLVSLLAAAGALGLVMLGCSGGGEAEPSQGSPSTSPAGAAEGETAVIAAVGDIACNSFPREHERRCRYNDVAEAIRQMDPDRFLALGDLQYLHGSLEGFQTYYDRYFGDLKDITSPVPGNHETYTAKMSGYFAYFGKRARPSDGWGYPSSGGYYSFDLGGWHFIALNSQACKGSTWNPDTGHGTPISANPIHTNGCGPGDSMYEWLRKDLALHPASEYPCTVAYFHHALYAWWPYGQTVAMGQIQSLWEVLDEGGVDVVLNGHFHNYQRWAPQDAFGRPDPEGMTEFIVGTGGDTYENDFPVEKEESPPSLETYQASSFGVLKMTLHTGTYDYEFVTAPGQRPFEDAGQDVACR